MIVLGVDPGVTGALSLVSMRGPKLIGSLDMPVVDLGTKTRRVLDQRAVLGWVQDSIGIDATIDAAVIEHQQPMPGSAATSYYMLGGMAVSVGTVIYALGIPIHFATPVQWKVRAGLKGGDKKASLARARQIFGAIEEFRRVKDHGRAESALIAFFGLPDRVLGSLRSEAA